MVEEFELPRTRSRSRATPVKDEEVEEVAPPEDSHKREAEEIADEAQESSNKKRRV